MTHASAIVISSLVAALAACGASARPTESPQATERSPDPVPLASRRGPLEVGESAPDWSLVDAGGARRALGALRAGGPVVVIFYQGSWCSTCRETLARFQERAAAIAEAGATLVAISKDTPEKSRRLADTLALSFPLLADPDLEATQGFGVVQAAGGLALAAVFVIDQEGATRWVQLGEEVLPDRVLDAVRALNPPAP